MPALRTRPVLLASLSAALLALFVVSAWIAQTGRLAGADGWVEMTARSRGTRAADIVASLVAVTAGIGVAAVWCLLLVAAAALQPRLRLMVAAVLVVLAAEQVVELVLKTVLDHPGPPSIGRIVFDLGAGPQTQGSFPSGHMIRAIVLGGGTAIIAGRRAGLAAAAVYVAAVAATRVYLGEHWLSDVIGGALLGLAALPIVALTVPRHGETRERAAAPVAEPGR